MTWMQISIKLASLHWLLCGRALIFRLRNGDSIANFPLDKVTNIQNGLKPGTTMTGRVVYVPFLYILGLKVMLSVVGWISRRMEQDHFLFQKLFLRLCQTILMQQYHWFAERFWRSRSAFFLFWKASETDRHLPNQNESRGDFFGDPWY